MRGGPRDWRSCPGSHQLAKVIVLAGTMNHYPRALCPHCGREAAVSFTNRVRRHREARA